MKASKRSRRGLLVAIEGIDGAGKSTLLKGLARTLRAAGWRVGRWKEPSDTTLGHAARHFSGVDPAQAALLFTLDRGARWATLDRLLRRVDVVLSDRSFYSTLAYQGQALSTRERVSLENLQYSLAHLPDLVLWLDLPPAESLRRVAARGGARSPLERLKVLKATAEMYRAYAREKPRRFSRLDARAPAGEVLQEALSAFSVRFRKPRRRASRAPGPRTRPRRRKQNL